MFKKLRDRIEEIRWEDAADPSRWVKFVRGQVRLYFYILRELVRNRCPQQAAALTFTTLLSLVPLFAVAFSIFRGFAALEGVEERAQDAIFRTILAAPLLETQDRRQRQAAPEAEEGLPVVRMSSAQSLAEADRRTRIAGAGATLRLYVRALNAGADPAQVRRGMSTLHLVGVASLRQTFALMQADAQAAYYGAAGLDAGPGPPQAALPAEAEQHYKDAISHTKGGRHLDAVESLALAEKAGYPAIAARQAAGEAHEALGDARADQREPAEAVGHYRDALLNYCDALVLAGRAAENDELRRLARRHGEAVKKLGRALFELGKEEAELYAVLLAHGDAEADQTLEAALRDLSEAAGALEHSGEVHAALGDLYEKAGRQEEALQEYKTALQKGREAEARAISLAVVDHIRLFIDKVGRLEIGALGLIFLLVTATSLLNTVERTLNNIWKVTERRPLWIKFTSFCTLIWLGPVLIGTSVWGQERLGAYIRLHLGGAAVIGQVVQVLTAVGEQLLPFVTTWLVLMAVYKFLPHTRVRFGSAAWGAFLASLLLHGARPLFSLYVLKAVKYERIYGSLGAVPIFLLWIWLLWIIVLFGAEVCFTIQNVGLLRYRDKLHRLSSIFIDRCLAARIMMYVAREFWQTGKPATASRLAEILQTTTEEAADAAGRLVRLGLLTPVGEQRDAFHPARDLSKLKLSEVLGITDRFRDDSRSTRPEDKPYEDRLERAFRLAIESQDKALQDMTFRDLLQQCEEERNKWPRRAPSQEE